MIPKEARTTSVTIPMDSAHETAFLEARQTLDSVAEHLLATYPARVDQAAARAGVMRDDPEGRARIAATVLAEDEKTIGDLQDTAEKALERLNESSQTFVFRSLGRTATRELYAAHPPTDEDHANVRATLEDEKAKAPYHEATFAPALVKAASVDPVLSDDDIREIFEGDTWNNTEVTLLYMTAMTAQTGGPRL